MAWVVVYHNDTPAGHCVQEVFGPFESDVLADRYVREHPPIWPDEQIDVCQLTNPE